MAKQTINIGASPNDGTGTPLRTSFDYCNLNFTELYTALGGGVGLPGATTQVIFNDGGTNLAGDAGLVYNKTTDALTVGGLVTAGSATISGALGAAGLNVTGATIPSNGVYLSAANNLAFSTGGSNRVTIDSGGTIGVGITAPFADAGYKAIDLRGTTGGEVVLGSTSVREATITGDGTNGMTLNTVNATPLRFFTQGVERAQFNTTGNLAFANGKGIDFSAVTGGTGTATANVLNDYEEGTFTPTVFGTTDAGSASYTRSGYYTKVGRLVTITVYMNWTAHTGTGNMRFGGLPFTSANVATNYNGISIGYVNNIALTAGNVLYGLLEFGTTYITVTQSPTGGGAYSLVPIDTSAEIAFTATYFV